MSNRWRDVAAGLFAVAWGANQFVSMIVAYRIHRGISTATNDGLFGSYAVALIIALLLGGPAADLWGRRVVVRPAVVTSLLATVLLMAGQDSVPLLYAGRVAAGLASGAIFAAGTAWVKELSASSSAAGARRAALALTLGFGLGPLVTGIVAQWAPDPLVLAYVPHLLIAAAALPLVWRAPETVVPEPGGPSFAARLRVPAAGQRRFLRVVAPAAPWVFGAPSVAFAVLPSLVSDHLHGYAVVFSAVMAATTLGTGVLVQPFARRLDGPGRLDAMLLGLAATVVGTLVGVLAAVHGNPLLALVATVPLGAGYGMGLVSGLLETQRLAAADELAGLTAVYYALTYVGFALPLLLAELDGLAGYPVLLLGVAGLALLSLLAVLSARGVQPGVLRSESAAELK
ncbi:MFS transporter [uncultured Jatrophihabitans sp.]|uniref:MFS transporter n=1 Tax=uncultured Jatrophihabitans sp. TaxID=1610747 RepID=UPI0035CBEC4D